MLCDHVPLDLSQGKIAGGVAQGPAGVEKAVEPVAFVRHMPVVEKVIVQKSAPDQGLFIQPDLQIAVQEPGDQEAGAGDCFLGHHPQRPSDPDSRQSAHSDPLPRSLVLQSCN